VGHALVGGGRRGIEEQSQIATPEAIGCKMGQGFLLAKPSSAEATESLLDPDAPAQAVGLSV